MQESRKKSPTRRRLALILTLIWIAAFALVNYPVGHWLGHRIEPFVLGIPFSLFYFWIAYTLLIVIGIVLAWKLWRD